MTWLVIAAALAVSIRMTRLVVADELTAPVRESIRARLGPHSRVVVLVNCFWCAGFWIAIGSAVTAYFAQHILAWQIFAVACGISWLQAVAAAWLDD